MAKYSEEFKKRGVKLLGLSCDDINSHKEWVKDIEAYTVSSHSSSYIALKNMTRQKLNYMYVHACCMQPGAKVDYPIISDPTREIIKQLNMVDPYEKDSNGSPMPSRALHIVGPDYKVPFILYLSLASSLVIVNFVILVICAYFG